MSIFKKTGKIAAILSAAALCLTSMAIPAAADTIAVDGEMDDTTGLVYKATEDGSGWIVSCLQTSENNPVTGDVVIPEKWANKAGEEKTVIKVAYALFVYPKNIISLSIPKTVTEIVGRYIGGNPGLQSITVDADNANFTAVDGVLYNKNKTKLVKYPTQKSETLFTVPDTVKTIETNAFSHVFNLTSITIPNGVAQIEYDTFVNCMNIDTLSIPASVWNIGPHQSFFAKYDVAADSEYFCSVDGVLFNKEKTILVDYPKGMTETSYVIPDTVTEINAMGLMNFDLKEVTIPASVTYMGWNIFQPSVQNSIKINYAGTKEQWAAIDINSENFTIKQNGVTCSDGVIEGTGVPANTVIQSPSNTTNESGNTEYTPEVEVKQPGQFTRDTMENVKDVRVEAPADAFANPVKLQVAPTSVSTGQFAVDISFVKADGIKVQPAAGKSVTVKIPVPESMQSASEIFVYHTDDNGKMTKVEAATETVDGKKYVVFTASSFSVYTLSSTAIAEAEAPGSNSSNNGGGYTVIDLSVTTSVSDTQAAAPETTSQAAAETTASAAAGSADGSDKNQATGVAIAVIPAVLAAAAVVISKKNK